MVAIGLLGLVTLYVRLGDEPADRSAPQKGTKGPEDLTRAG
jgi:hypothetical protein